MKKVGRFLKGIGFLIFFFILSLLVAWRVDRAFFHPYQPDRDMHIQDAVTTTKFSIPKTKEACLEKGGIWGKIGIRPIEECNLKTTDAGKICSGSNQCEGVCLADMTEEERKKGMRGRIWKTQGTCSDVVKVVGCRGYVYVGWASVICSD